MPDRGLFAVAVIAAAVVGPMVAILGKDSAANRRGPTGRAGIALMTGPGGRSMGVLALTVAIAVLTGVQYGRPRP